VHLCAPARSALSPSSPCSNLYNNKLSGTIPPSLGSLTSLTMLCVLCRALPPQLFLSLSASPHSGFESNLLSGTIPSSMGSLSLLQFLCVRESGLPQARL